MWLLHVTLYNVLVWRTNITLHNVLVWRTNFHRFGITAYDDIWLLHILCALVIEFVWFLQKSHSSPFSLGARTSKVRSNTY